MKDLMSMQHHGAMHLPRSLVWMHTKHVDLALLLVGLLVALVLGLATLGNRGDIMFTPMSPYQEFFQGRSAHP